MCQRFQGHLPVVCNLRDGRCPICVVRRLGPGLAADAAVAQGKTAEPSAMALGTVPRAEFVSNKLAPKLAQQLKVGYYYRPTPCATQLKYTGWDCMGNVPPVQTAAAYPKRPAWSLYAPTSTVLGCQTGLAGKKLQSVGRCQILQQGEENMC